MGRPLPKKYFGSGTGNQIQVRAKIGSAAEGTGFIVKQTGSHRFLVTVGSNTGVCTITDKADGTLAAGDMTISVKDSTNTIVRIVAIKGRTVVTNTDVILPWSFNPAVNGHAEMADVEGSLIPVITIGTQPSSQSVVHPAPTTFTVAATVSNGETLSYQWQVKVGAAAYTNVSGATSATLSISDTTGLTGNQYKCIVSSTGGSTPVTSSAATLTVS